MAGTKGRPRRRVKRPDTAGQFGRRKAILVAFLLLALGAWGIASHVARMGSGDKSLESGGREATGVSPGRKAPDFTIQTADGASFRLSDQRGRVVLLDFLAPG